MDDRDGNNNRRRHRHHQSDAMARHGPGNGYASGEEEAAEAGGETEAWNDFSRSFGRVQSVLDRNRVLIQQVNDNHQSRMPENMARNVPLIRELNGNISKVVGMYSDLSTNFSSVVQDRRQGTPARNNNVRASGGR